MADNKIEVGLELNLNEFRQDLNEAETLMQQGVARLASIGEQAQAEQILGGEGSESGTTPPSFASGQKPKAGEQESTPPPGVAPDQAEKASQLNGQNTLPPGVPPEPPKSKPDAIAGTTTQQQPSGAIPAAVDPLGQAWERFRQIQGTAAAAPQVAATAANQLKNQAIHQGVKDPDRAGEWEKLITATQELTRSIKGKQRQEEQHKNDKSEGSIASLMSALKLGAFAHVGGQVVSSAASGNLMGAAGSLIGGGIGLLGGPVGMGIGAGIGNAIGSGVQGLVNSADSARQYQINQAGVAARFGDPSNLESLGIQHFYEGDHSGYKVTESLQLADTLREKHVISDPSSQSSQELIEALQALTRATGQNIDAITNQYAQYKTGGGDRDANDYMAQVIGGAIQTGFESHTQEYGEMLSSARMQVVQRSTGGDEGDGALKKIQSLMLGLMGGESSTSAFLRDNPAAAQQEISKFLQSGATSTPYGYEAVAMQIAGVDASETSEAYATPDQQAENATKRMGYVLNRSLFSAEGLQTLGMSRDELAAATQADPDFLRNKLSSDNPDKEQAKHLQDLVNVHFGFQYARDPKSQDIAMLTQLGNVSLANNGQIPLNAVTPDGQKVNELLNESQKTPGQEALDSIAAREDAIARGLEKLTPALNAMDKTVATFAEGVTDLGEKMGIFDSITGAAEGFASSVEGALVSLNKSIEMLVVASGEFQKTTGNWLIASKQAVQDITERFNGGMGAVIQDPEWQDKSRGFSADGSRDAPITNQLGAIGDFLQGGAGDAWRFIHDQFNDTPEGGVTARSDYNIFKFAPGDIIHAKQNRNDLAAEIGVMPASSIVHPQSTIAYNPPATQQPQTIPVPAQGDRSSAQFAAAVSRFEQSINRLIGQLGQETRSSASTSAASVPPAGIARAPIATMPPAGVAPRQAAPKVEIERASLDRFRASVNEHNDRFARLGDGLSSRLGAIATREVDGMNEVTGRHNERFRSTADQFNSEYDTTSADALGVLQTRHTEHQEKLTGITTEHTTKFGFTTEEFNTLFSLSGVHFNTEYDASGKALNKQFGETTKDFAGKYDATSKEFNNKYKSTNDSFFDNIQNWFGRMFGMLGQSAGAAKVGLGGLANFAAGAMGGGGNPTKDDIVLALISSLESPTREGRVDVATAIHNRVNATKLGEGNYGNSVTEVAFAEGQFEPFFGRSASSINSMEDAAKMFAEERGVSIEEAQRILQQTLGDLSNAAMVAESRQFVGGRTDFKGVSEYGNMHQGEDKLRSSGENFFHIGDGQTYEQLDRIAAANTGSSLVSSGATAGNLSGTVPSGAGAIPFEGIYVTSAIDASGEPGLDYVVNDGQRGAQFGALAAGQVIEVVDDQNWESHLESGGTERGYGNQVIVRAIDQVTGEFVDMLYAHLDTVAVQVGQQVAIGTPLGTQGRTGSTTGAHVSVDFFAKDANYAGDAQLAMRDRIARQLANDTDGFNTRVGTEQNISYNPAEGHKPIASDLVYRPTDEKNLFDAPFFPPAIDDGLDIHKPAAEPDKTAAPKAFDKLALPKPESPQVGDPIHSTFEFYEKLFASSAARDRLGSRMEQQEPDRPNIPPALSQSNNLLSGMTAPFNPDAEIVPFGQALPPMRDAAIATPSTQSEPNRRDRPSFFERVDGIIDDLPLPRSVRQIADPLLGVASALFGRGGLFGRRNRQEERDDRQPQGERPDLTITPDPLFLGNRQEVQAIPFGEPLPPMDARSPQPSQSQIIPFGQPLPPLASPAAETPIVPFGQPLPPMAALPAGETTPETVAPTPTDQPAIVPFGQPLPALPQAQPPAEQPLPEHPIDALEPLLSALIAPLNSIAKSLAERGNVLDSVPDRPKPQPFKDYTQFLHGSASEILKAEPLNVDATQGRFSTDTRGSDQNLHATVYVTVMTSSGSGGDVREQARQGAHDGIIAARDEFADRWDEGSWDRRNQPRMRTRIH